MRSRVLDLARSSHAITDSQDLYQARAYRERLFVRKLLFTASKTTVRKLVTSAFVNANSDPCTHLATSRTYSTDY